MNRAFKCLSVLVCLLSAAGSAAVGSDVVDFRQLEKGRLRAHPYIFSGEQLPRCDFTDTAQARRAVPDYAVSARYFDSDFNEVEKAMQPGRYGAVVTYGNSNATRRAYMTLYRLANADAPVLQARTQLDPSAPVD